MCGKVSLTVHNLDGTILSYPCNDDTCIPCGDHIMCAWMYTCLWIDIDADASTFHAFHLKYLSLVQIYMSNIIILLDYRFITLDYINYSN